MMIVAINKNILYKVYKHIFFNHKIIKMKQLLYTGFILLSFVLTACDGSNDSKVNSTTATDKKEQLAKDEMYTCTMHNEVLSDHEGECPKCGMKLQKQKMTAEQQKMMKEGTFTKPKN